MGAEDICEAGLVLRLGYEGWAAPPTVPPADSRRRVDAGIKPEPLLRPSLTLSLSADTSRTGTDAGAGGGEEPRLARQSSPHSAVSSFSGACTAPSSSKRERDGASEEAEAERVVSSRASDDEEGSARKKLRLTKEQSALLEDMFREHATLNPKQKQALARQLNLRPRQVEVWFQNRRARTKLKQTEMDCEFLRRCCENLTDENRRLQKELQELKALKLASPLYLQHPAATLTMCPSCERMGVAAGDAAKGGAAVGGPFSTALQPHFYNSLAAAHPPPAAC